MLAKRGAQPCWSHVLADFLRKKLLIVAHHLMVGSVLCPMMMTRLDHEPGELMLAAAMLMEGSTPFVSLRGLLSHLDLKSSRAYLINGVLMLASFFTCRIAAFPLFYWALAKRRGAQSVMAVMASTPPRCAILMSLVCAPQVYWFAMMVRGAARVLESRKEAKATQAKANDQHEPAGNSHARANDQREPAGNGHANGRAKAE